VDALGRVAAERLRQDIKWGEQHHPDGTNEGNKSLADQAREICEQEFARGRGTWRLILGEEFFEAMVETDPDKLREELAHVAAVAVSWIEDIDSRERP
jgi:hypothetical protein